MTSLDDFARDKLRALDARGQRRTATSTRRLKNARVERTVDGRLRTLIDFSSNDALGLAHEDAVVAAARKALDDGAGSGGSRLVSGAHPSIAVLEEKLAALKHKEAALITGSGWLANVGVVPALVGPAAAGKSADVVVVDEFAHASLFAGIKLSGARVLVAAHNDVVDFTRQVRSARAAGSGARVLVVTESVFSMDGDTAPLAALRALCDQHGAWLLVDDAHGFLVVDDDAAAAVACADVVTGTLSKAVGGYGGVVAASRVVCDLLLTRCRPVLFGTALPPSVVAAAAAALDVAVADPARRRRPLALARRFCRVLGDEGLELPEPASHIVPLIVGDEARAMTLMHGLIDDGFLVVAIRPPTVPVGTSRLRVGFCAVHTDADVDALAAALRRRWQR